MCIARKSREPLLLSFDRHSSASWNPAFQALEAKATTESQLALG
jgi:hypothetical protein